MFDKPEWGTGDRGYVWIKVHDTGRGMNADEQKKLFARFSQASPRRFYLDHVTIMQRLPIIRACIFADLLAS